MRSRWVIAIVAAALLVAACSSGGGGSDGGSLAADIRSLPAVDLDNPAVVEVHAVDIRRAERLADLDRPDLDDSDSIREWVQGLLVGPDRIVHVTAPELFRNVADPAAATEELGFWLDAVDRHATVFAIPESVSILHGSDLEGKLSDLVTDLDGDVKTLGEGEDFETDPANRTPLRQLGRPLRIRADGGTLVMSRSTDGVRDPDDGDRLVDQLPVIDQLVGLLDDLDVYAMAVLVSPDADGRAVGLGWSVDDDAPLVHGVVVGLDLAEVEERLAGDSVNSTWPDQSSIESLTEADDAVVFSLRPIDAPPELLYRAVVTGDPLFEGLLGGS